MKTDLKRLLNIYSKFTVDVKEQNNKLTFITKLFVIF